MGLSKPTGPAAGGEVPTDPDARVASQLQFAPCARSEHVEGHNDWLCINDPRYHDFDICPQCYEVSLSRTRYAHLFSRAAPKPSDVATICDFSRIWVRMAWIWILWRDLPDALLLAQVAAIQTRDGPCPNPLGGGVLLEKPTAERLWFTIQNPDTHQLMDQWTICSHCMASIETILPPIRGFLVPVAPNPVSACCDMVPGSDRTMLYVDQLFDIAANAIDKRVFDMRPMARFIEEYASIPECPKDNVVNRPCHTIPSIPELTVCEDCYRAVVVPSQQSGSQLARSFSANAAFTQGWTCQLYSPRARQTWENAVSTNDMNFLRTKAVERKQHERETVMKLQQLKMKIEQCMIQTKYYNNLSLVQTASILNTQHNLMATGHGWVADFSGPQAQRAKAGDMMIEIGRAQDEMKMITNEWKSFWE